MPAPAQPLAAGTQLESYRIQRLLATGGFSYVYLAHDENDVPVAIKEYRIAGYGADPDGNTHDMSKLVYSFD